MRLAVSCRFCLINVNLNGKFFLYTSNPLFKNLRGGTAKGCYTGHKKW